MYFIFFILTGCTQLFVRQKTSDTNFAKEDTELSMIPEETDSSYVEIIYYEEEEALLAQILQYYDAALNAYEEGDLGLAETKIDSASILSALIDLNIISDEFLVLRYKNTLASIFQEYGKILKKSGELNSEDT